MFEKMKNKSVYIFPDSKNSTNDYIISFHKSFANQGYTLNNRRSNLRLLNILFNLDSDIFIFHWVDALPHLKYGFFQVYFFKLIITILSLQQKEIIWVLHNKTSHKNNSKDKIVSSLMTFMAKKATKIVVHAKEGVIFCKERFNAIEKVLYIPHPSYSLLKTSDNRNFKWDYIVWGTINKYKQIDVFLDFVNRSDYFLNKKILICGKCDDLNYDRIIKDKMNSNITYFNEFISDEKLEYLISKSKNILFTYSPETVLSSGALIHSLSFANRIIGPSVGNFLDYPEHVFCYTSYDDIIKITEKDYQINLENRSDLLVANSWNDFPLKLFK